MEIRKRAISGFTKIKDDELLVKAITVLEAMEHNPHFPDAPHLEELRQRLEPFQELMALGRHRRRQQDTAEKLAHRKLVQETLKKIAFYVNHEAKDNVAHLLSSGLEIKGIISQSDIPEAVTNIRLSQGKESGQLRLDFKLQPNRILYEYRYAHEQRKNGTFRWSRSILTGFSLKNIILVVPFQRYYVQVRSLSNTGKSEWSEPVSYVVR